MSLHEEVPHSGPEAVLLRSRLYDADENAPKEFSSENILSLPTSPLHKALRRRTAVGALDEENRIESSTPKSLPVASRPIEGSAVSAQESLFGRIDIKSQQSVPVRSMSLRIDSIRGETEKFFDEIIASTPSIFLCWGRPEDCRIIQVPVEDEDNWSFQELHDAWYAARGNWRRWLPMFGIVSVARVQVCQHSNCAWKEE